MSAEFDSIKYKNMVHSFQKNDNPLGWFEHIYTDARGDYRNVFWADLEPSPYLLKWLNLHMQNMKEKKAIVIGCGVGDDAEAISQNGYAVTAFDISKEAINLCKKRYPNTKVHYIVENLFDYPSIWSNYFDLVYECNTIQVLPLKYRTKTIDAIVSLLAKGAYALVSCRSRLKGDQLDDIPLPLEKEEINKFKRGHIKESTFLAYDDNQTPPVAHFFATYKKDD